MFDYPTWYILEVQQLESDLEDGIISNKQYNEILKDIDNELYESKQ